MDVLRYQDAYVKLRDVERNSVFGDLMDIELKGLLKRQVETLKILQGGSIKETPQNLVDLYFKSRSKIARSVREREVFLATAANRPGSSVVRR